jgi:hypothetical protein
MNNKFSSRLTINAINDFVTFSLTQTTRCNILLVKFLIDIVQNQGDSPANIIERLMNDRNSTTGTQMIKLLESWGYVKLVEKNNQNDSLKYNAKKAVYLADKGATDLLLSRNL